MVAELTRARQGLDDLARHLAGAFPRRVGKHNDELIATDARHGIHASHTALQALRDFDQQLVADRMAECVVHLLEVIEIDEHQGNLALFAFGNGQLMIQAILQ